jgi:putative ABC transport system substrate-binding protein
MRIARRSVLQLGVAAAAWPLAARAQQQAMPVVGYFSARSPRTDVPMLAAFHRGLGEAGYIEGKNVAMEFRWANGQYDRLSELAADLVQRRVSVIVTTGGSPSALAAKPHSLPPYGTGSIHEQKMSVRARCLQNLHDLPCGAERP